MPVGFLVWLDRGLRPPIPVGDSETRTPEDDSQKSVTGGLDVNRHLCPWGGLTKQQ